jgi:hypothetical protein
MGQFVQYALELRIRRKNFARALAIFNHLHTPAVVRVHGHSSGPHDRHHYAWVDNPQGPYPTLEAAFKNWRVVERDVRMYIDDATRDFVLQGKYMNKLGDQEFLLTQLAPVLRNMRTVVQYVDFVPAPNRHRLWSLTNHVFTASDITPDDDAGYESDASTTSCSSALALSPRK